MRSMHSKFTIHDSKYNPYKVKSSPTQVQSTQHTRSSSTKLTCSSTAAWLSPVLLPNNPFRSTAAACPVPRPPAASAKPNVPVMSSAACSNEGEATNQRGLLAECRPQQVSFEALPGQQSYGAFIVRSWIPTDISVTCANQSAACGTSATHETSNKVSAHFPNHQHWSCLRRRPIAAPKMPQQASAWPPADRRRCSDW